MAVTMSTLGSHLTVRPGVDERDLVAFAREVLEQELTGFDLHPKYGADLDRVRAATTLESLLAAFALVLVRDQAGAAVATFGVDDVATEPAKVLAALAPGLADGSFLAHHQPEPGIDCVVQVRDGVAMSVVLPEGSLCEPGWRARAALTGEELAQRLAAQDGLVAPAHVVTRPDVADEVAFDLCATGTPFVLPT